MARFRWAMAARASVVNDGRDVLAVGDILGGEHGGAKGNQPTGRPESAGEVVGLAKPLPNPA